MSVAAPDAIALHDIAVGSENRDNAALIYGPDVGPTIQKRSVCAERRPAIGIDHERRLDLAELAPVSSAPQMRCLLSGVNVG